MTRAAVLVASVAVLCPADSTISTGTFIRGAAFNGTVTLDGHTYADVNSEPLVDHLALLLEGTIHIPEWRNESVTISAPFAATGNFSHNVGTPFLFQVPINGSGTVTLNLAPNPTIGLWDVGPFRYHFVATPTPEPATVTLISGGLVAAALAGESAGTVSGDLSCGRLNCMRQRPRRSLCHELVCGWHPRSRLSHSSLRRIPSRSRTGASISTQFGQIATTRLLGTDGFRFESLSAVNGLGCGGDCTPGPTTAFNGSLEDAFGTAHVIVDGRGFNLPVRDDTASLRIFTGTVTLPPVTPGRVVLTFPFGLEGLLEDSDILPNGTVVSFSGRGTARLELMSSPPPFVTTWEILQEDYNFAPTPEPGTLILLAGGLVGVIGRNHVRRRMDASA